MPMHIVHVENGSPLRDILKSALQAAQPMSNLQQFDDGESALAYIERYGRDVDLFIIDICLPGQLTGLDLTSKIRMLACPGYVVLTSGDAPPPQEFLALHRSEYFPKPWHVLKLTQQLHRYKGADKTVKMHPSAAVTVESGDRTQAHLPPTTLFTDTPASGTKQSAAALCRTCGAALTGNLGVCLKCGTIVKPSAVPETARIQSTQSAVVGNSARGTASLSNASVITLTLNGNKLRVLRTENIIIGRFYVGQPCETVVDLSSFDAHKYGVSRRHLKLSEKDGMLYLTDLDSSNGTFLNDTRVLPYTEHLVRSGDMLRLGVLEIRVEF
jgi:DNA-binding NarL/FixJ family response regulator